MSESGRLSLFRLDYPNREQLTKVMTDVLIDRLSRRIDPLTSPIHFVQRDI